MPKPIRKVNRLASNSTPSSWPHSENRSSRVAGPPTGSSKKKQKVLSSTLPLLSLAPGPGSVGRSRAVDPSMNLDSGDSVLLHSAAKKEPAVHRRDRNSLEAIFAPPAYDTTKTLNSVSAGEDPVDEWSEGVHRSFVEAIYEIGKNHASPALVIDCMKTNELITKERVKSHLQKYRSVKAMQKSKEAFLADYDSWMKDTLGMQIKSSRMLARKIKSGSPSSGEMAAFLSLSCMLDDDTEDKEEEEGVDITVGIEDRYSDNVKGFLDLEEKSFPMPILTEQEMKTPLGAMFAHVQGCFSMMQKRLEERRGVNVPGEAPPKKPLPGFAVLGCEDIDDASDDEDSLLSMMMGVVETQIERHSSPALQGAVWNPPPAAALNAFVQDVENSLPVSPTAAAPSKRIHGRSWTPPVVPVEQNSNKRARQDGCPPPVSRPAPQRQQGGSEFKMYPPAAPPGPPLVCESSVPLAPERSTSRSGGNQQETHP